MGENNPLATPVERDIILFDGICTLCNRAVLFILKRDHKNNFVITSLQSKVAQQLLEDHGYKADNLNSIVVLTRSSKLLTQSNAVLFIARHLTGGWKLLYILKIIPAPIRDLIYRFIASYRYRIFGRREQCMRPRPGWEHKFLVDS